MHTYPSKIPVTVTRLTEAFSPQEIDKIVHLAYSALQCFDLFEIAATSFNITDDQLLDLYDRIGLELGIKHDR